MLLALGALALMVGGTALAVGQKADRTTKKSRLKAQLASGDPPKNVIFLLGDGMSNQEITAARYYTYGAAGRMNVDRLPFTGFNTTWSLKPGTGRLLPDYDPDSASTGTAWATGNKTIDERVSQGPSTAIEVPGDNTDYRTVLEKAQAAGKKVGDVSTAEITDATPAVLASHISLRGCQGPADTAKSCAKETKDAGGLGSIAEQEVDHKVDVLLGGGRARFEQTVTGGSDKGKTVVQSAQGKGYRYVTSSAGLNQVTNLDQPVLGLFTPGNMTTEWSGPTATPGAGFPAQKCNETNRPSNEPSLAAMTRRAISLLGARKNRKGFFLQVEGASIDKQDHAANPCAQVGETVAFDDAVGVALDYQRSHPDTLVVVSADHSHTSEIVSEDSTGTGNPTGYSGNLTTRDNQTMRMTYGTAGYGGEGKAPVTPPPSQQHTGGVVPVWGTGPTAYNVLGTNDQTDLFRLLSGEGDAR